jgi:hypothetical protein
MPLESGRKFIANPMVGGDADESASCSATEGAMARKPRR